MKKKITTILHQIQSPEKKVGLFEIWSLEKKKLLKIAEKKNICRTSFLLSAGPRNKQFFLDGLSQK